MCDTHFIFCKPSAQVKNLGEKGPWALEIFQQKIAGENEKGFQKIVM